MVDRAVDLVSMLPLSTGQEVFVEARLPGGSLTQVGFAQIVGSTHDELELDLDAAPAARPIALGPGSRADVRADSLEPLQRVRLRLNDDTGSYYADTRVLRTGHRLVLEQPKRVEVEWQRMYFRIDLRLPFQLRVLGLDSDGAAKSLTTRDVSGGGLRYVARDGIEVGERVEVIIQLPHPPLITAKRLRAPTVQLYTGPITNRTYERKSLRPPPEPQTDPNMSACLIQAEARVVRCRMLWTSEDVTHDIGVHFTNINERARDRLIACLLDEQRRRKAMGLEEPRLVSRPPRVG